MEWWLQIYKITGKINHLMFKKDIKIFAGNEKELSRGLPLRREMGNCYYSSVFELAKDWSLKDK